MARYFPDLRRGVLLLLLMACALPTAPATVNVDKETEIEVVGKNPRLNLNAGTLLLDEVTLRQGPTTLIRAASTSATGLSEGYNNSQWEFTGAVHIEFENAVLDADHATVVFADNRLREVHVKGGPARFSHQATGGQRNEGRANTIDYHATTGLVKLAGDTWFSDGRNEANTAALTYDLRQGEVYNEQVTTDESGRFRMTIRPGKRIPTPRTPDRATSQ